MNLKRRTAVLWAIAAGAIILGTGAQTWIEASQISGLPGTTVTATGNQSAAVVPAMALVGMAAGIALSMARRIGRWVTSVLIVLAGTATVWASVQAALDPASAAQAQVSQTSGTTADAGAYAVTVWPWLTLVGGVLLALCGIAVLLFGRGWTTTRRYDTATTGTAATGAAAPSAATSSAATPVASRIGRTRPTGGQCARGPATRRGRGRTGGRARAPGRDRCLGRPEPGQGPHLSGSGGPIGIRQDPARPGETRRDLRSTVALPWQNERQT